MIKTTTFMVKDRQYTTTQYAGTASLRNLSKLFKVVGKPLAQLFKGPKVGFNRSESSILDVNVSEIIPQVIDALLENFDEENIVELVKTLLSTTTVIDEGVKKECGEHFDLVFAGRIGEAFKVLAKVIAIQFADFLPDLDVAGEAVKKSIKTAIKAK